MTLRNENNNRHTKKYFDRAKKADDFFIKNKRIVTLILTTDLRKYNIDMKTDKQKKINPKLKYCNHLI